MKWPSNTRELIRRIFWILPFSVLVSVVIAFTTTDVDSVVRLRDFAPGFFLLAVGLRLVPWITKTIRLASWLSFLGHRFSLAVSFRVTLMAELGAIISPTAIGGGPVKAGMLYHHGVSAGEATSLTTITAVEDLSMYLIGLPVAFLFSRRSDLRLIPRILPEDLSGWWWVPAIAVAIVLTVAAFLLVIRRRPRLMRRMRRRLALFWGDFRKLYVQMISAGKLRFVVNLLLAAVHWSARYSVVWALSLGLGFSADPLRFLLLQWLTFAAMAFVPTPGAAGGAEGVFLLLFSYHLPRHAIPTIMIGWRFIDFYFLAILSLAILGLELLIRDRNKERPIGER
jgi:hypothetical protein